MIVYGCPDLMFASKIKATADAEGLPSRPVRNADMLQRRLDQVDDGKLNEPVSLVIIDLGLEDAGLAMIRQAKAHDPALPVVAYGSHVLVEQLEAAKTAGADQVMTNGGFTAQLPEVLQLRRQTGS